jgi:Fe2+ or Zn2+ uptake regulation protein
MYPSAREHFLRFLRRRNETFNRSRSAVFEAVVKAKRPLDESEVLERAAEIKGDARVSEVSIRRMLQWLQLAGIVKKTIDDEGRIVFSVCPPSEWNAIETPAQ